jgi:hypothetical protein
VVRLFGGEGCELVVRECICPPLIDECTINALKRWVSTFIAPGVKATMKVELHQFAIVQEATKLIHHSSVKVTITFVLSFIDQVEISTKEPISGTVSTNLP